MASIKISQLNKTTTVTSDDFFPVVDSGSLTTFYTPVDALRSYMAISGAVPSSSWASASIRSNTAITSSRYVKVNGFSRFPSLVQEEAIKVCKYSGGSHMKTFLVSLHVGGLHTSCTKAYIINTQYTSPGVDLPWSLAAPYTGWFTARPVSSAHNYPFNAATYTDYDLELSHSNITHLSFRIRTTKAYPGPGPFTATSSLTILDLQENLIYNQIAGTVFENIITEETGTEASSNNLPVWPSAFVEQHGNYKFIVSGSILCEKGMTGSFDGPSLFGTSSWAVSSSYALLSKTSSFLNNTASFAATASYALSSSRTDIASYALVIPSSGPQPGLIPIGTIMDFAGASCPDENWLICSGSEVSQTTYSSLYAVLGTTWGTAGAGNFKLPDLRKRHTIGFRRDVFPSGDSWLSSSIGSVGGGEALNYHFHDWGFCASNDDFHYGFVHGLLNLTASTFPAVVVPGPYYRPRLQQAGDGTNGNPNAYIGNVQSFVYDAYNPGLNTSFGVSKNVNNWYSSSTGDWTTFMDYNNPYKFGYNDLNPPYAVVMKIIRAK